MSVTGSAEKNDIPAIRNSQELIRLPRSRKPLTSLLSELLATEIPIEMKRLLEGKKRDGARYRGRPRRGALPSLPENCTFGDALITALTVKAITGDTAAMKLIFLRLEGSARKETLSANFDVHTGTNSPAVLEKLMRMFSQKDSDAPLLDATNDNAK